MVGPSWVALLTVVVGVRVWMALEVPVLVVLVLGGEVAVLVVLVRSSMWVWLVSWVVLCMVGGVLWLWLWVWRRWAIVVSVSAVASLVDVCPG